MIDPEGNHQKCVFAHWAMTKYTGGVDDRLVRFSDEKQLKQLVLEAKKSMNLSIIIASRDNAMTTVLRCRQGVEQSDFEESLKACHNTHIMIIRDIIEGAPTKGNPAVLITDDYGKAYDRRVLPRSEWQRYFMRTAGNDVLTDASSLPVQVSAPGGQQLRLS